MGGFPSREKWESSEADRGYNCGSGQKDGRYGEAEDCSETGN